MEYLGGDAVANALEGLISRKRQQHHYETDLTAGRIFRVTKRGAVDFGGSEEEPAAREEVEPVKASPDDQYGWWELEGGMYVVSYNEVPSLADTQIAFIQPHERLLRAGGTHASYYFRETRDILEAILVVGNVGVRIKQNARVSKLLILQL
jgi:deoxycytidine triphosphate deaminase